MLLEPLKRLEIGDIEFLYRIKKEGLDKLIIDIRSSDNKHNIIKGCIEKIYLQLPDFTFEIIYDMDEYEEYVKRILYFKRFKNITLDKMVNMLYRTNYGPKLVIDNIDCFLSKDNTFINNICLYFINNLEKYKDFTIKLSRCDNLHTRYIFMDILISYYYNKCSLIYDDITKYFSNGKELMDINDICNLAIKYLKLGNQETYEKIKQFIYKNYKYNNLAYLLDKNAEDTMYPKYTDLRKNELDLNIDLLFTSSLEGKLIIYQKYADKISEMIRKNFENKMRYMMSDGEYKKCVNDIFKHRLGPKLEHYIDKYLSMSKSDDAGYITSGTTCSVYRVGDYVIKLLKTKWSYEDVICPNLYLIIKNEEEDYIRNKDNIVVAGIEVQKYLKRSAKEVPDKYFYQFEKQLSILGYRVNDTLINGSCGDNTRLLDTYKDADTDNPEILPDWFKEYPIVLIDRDRVYPKDKKLILQQNGRY